VTGRLDAFRWKVPVAEIGFERPPIEPDQIAPPVEPVEKAVPAAEEKPSPPIMPAETPPKSASRRKPQQRPAEKPVEPVIPIVHAPDDPGPDSMLEPDPVPEPTSSTGSGWDRLKSLFR
jgi:HemY protein